METLFSIAADVLMLAHLGYVTFVVLGFLLILIGTARDWTWVRNPLFRYAHLIAILIVVAEAWAGIVCPLTTWEKALRQLAGEGAYEGGFMTNLVRSVLFRDWPPWVFTVLYSTFGTSVLLTFVFAPPRRQIELPPPGVEKRGETPATTDWGC
jgi:polyferredoxin